MLNLDLKRTNTIRIPNKVGPHNEFLLPRGAGAERAMGFLERPFEFLKGASRVLKPDGRLAMIEPARTPVARRFYDYFHEEPAEMNVDIRLRWLPSTPVGIHSTQIKLSPAFCSTPRSVQTIRKRGSIATRPKRQMAQTVCISAEWRISELVADTRGAGSFLAGFRGESTGSDSKTNVLNDGRAGAHLEHMGFIDAEIVKVTPERAHQILSFGK